MIDVRDYIAYFQGIANTHKKINDFFIMDIREPVAAIRNEIRFPALILNNLSGSFRSSNLDLIVDEITGGFFVVDRLDSLEDFSAEMLILQNTKNISLDILSRMKHDLLQCLPLATKSIPGFNPSTVKYEMMDNVIDNWYGMGFSFKIFIPVNIDFDPLKWDENKSITGKYSY